MRRGHVRAGRKVRINQAGRDSRSGFISGDSMEVRCLARLAHAAHVLLEADAVPISITIDYADNDLHWSVNLRD